MVPACPSITGFFFLTRAILKGLTLQQLPFVCIQVLYCVWIASVGSDLKKMDLCMGRVLKCVFTYNLPP